jgi:DNA-binding transcriptional LysR family regulator
VGVCTRRGGRPGERVGTEVNEVGALLASCLGGQGITQVLELYVPELLADGRLVQVLPEWAEETYPLYAYHHSAQLASAKARAFLDFVVVLTRDSGSTGTTAAAGPTRRQGPSMRREHLHPE